MPRGDRTGPSGMGPMTGRGMGYCAGFDRPGYMQRGMALEWVLGGLSRGWIRLAAHVLCHWHARWARYGMAPSLPPVPPR